VLHDGPKICDGSILRSQAPTARAPMSVALAASVANNIPDIFISAHGFCASSQACNGDDNTAPKRTESGRGQRRRLAGAVPFWGGRHGSRTRSQRRSTSMQHLLGSPLARRLHHWHTSTTRLRKSASSCCGTAGAIGHSAYCLHAGAPHPPSRLPAAGCCAGRGT
jgi:hypothetical protein